MTVSQALALSGSGFSQGEDFVFGIDLSAEQDLQYGSFTAVRGKVYTVRADLSRKTKLCTFVDCCCTRSVLDFLKVFIDFAAYTEDEIQQAVVSAAENGGKLRCVYKGHGQSPIICNMIVTRLETDKGDIAGNVIKAELSM